MSKQDSVAYYYTGTKGEHFSHVPARDLTVREFERLSPLNQVQVRAAAFYSDKPAKDDKPVAPADKE
jgi:hypothetical protein